MKEEMGIALLDTELSEDNPYMLGNIFGDKTDFYSLDIQNFILGDTSDYQYLPEENRYTYKKGAEYCSPVSLGVNIILSESQLKKGWNVDYLGMYEFVEQFESEQGYKVNLIQSAGGDAKMQDGYVCRKCAVFVADGIYYTLTGQVSIEKMKEIVNTMRVE